MPSPTTKPKVTYPSPQPHHHCRSTYSLSSHNLVHPMPFTRTNLSRTPARAASHMWLGDQQRPPGSLNVANVVSNNSSYPPIRPSPGIPSHPTTTSLLKMVTPQTTACRTSHCRSDIKTCFPLTPADVYQPHARMPYCHPHTTANKHTRHVHLINN